MHAIEQRHPSNPLLPPDGSAARARVDGLIERCAAVLQSGARVSYPNATATTGQIAAAQSAFEAELEALDAAVAEGGGPFLSGASFTLADAMCARARPPLALSLRATPRATCHAPRATRHAPRATLRHDAAQRAARAARTARAV